MEYTQYTFEHTQLLELIVRVVARSEQEAWNTLRKITDTDYFELTKETINN